jgi:hypothetical protein
VGRLAEVILEQKAVDGLRPLRALIRLADTYSAQRLSRACERALRFGTPCYSSVKSILANSLDRLPTEAAVDEQGQTVFRFSRRGSDFDPDHIRDSSN